MTSDSNPITQREMAKNLKMSQENINYHIQKTLRNKTRKKVKADALPHRNVEMKRVSSPPLYRKLCNWRWQKYITKVEVMICLAVASRENSIQHVSKDIKNVKIECFTRRENHSKAFIVWAGISKNGKTHLNFVDPGVKIDSQNCINHILKPFCLKMSRYSILMEITFFIRMQLPLMSLIWSQSLWSREWSSSIRQTMPKSPDVFPMDYFVWDWMKKAMTHIKISNISDLKKALRRVRRWLPQKNDKLCA